MEVRGARDERERVRGGESRTWKQLYFVPSQQLGRTRHPPREGEGKRGKRGVGYRRLLETPWPVSLLRFFFRSLLGSSVGGGGGGSRTLAARSKGYISVGLFLNLENLADGKNRQLMMRENCAGTTWRYCGATLNAQKVEKINPTRTDPESAVSTLHRPSASNPCSGPGGRGGPAGPLAGWGEQTPAGYWEGIGGEGTTFTFSIKLNWV